MFALHFFLCPETSYNFTTFLDDWVFFVSVFTISVIQSIDVVSIRYCSLLFVHIITMNNFYLQLFGFECTFLILRFFIISIIIRKKRDVYIRIWHSWLIYTKTCSRREKDTFHFILRDRFELNPLNSETITNAYCYFRKYLKTLVLFFFITQKNNVFVWQTIFFLKNNHEYVYDDNKHHFWGFRIKVDRSDKFSYDNSRHRSIPLCIEMIQIETALMKKKK